MNKLFVYIFIALLALGGAQNVSAQNGLTGGNETYTLLEPLPCIEGVGDCKNTGDKLTEITSITVNDYVRYMYKFALALAVFLATVMIIWGGFEYTISAANPSSKSDAKKRINSAIYGLIAILVSYLILRTIDPRLVLVSSELPKICAPEQMKRGGICDPSGFKDFNQIFQDRIKDITAEKQLKVLELESRLTEVRRQQISYQSMFDNNQITKEDYDVRIAELAQERADLELQQIVAVTDGLGVSTYREGYGLITNGASKEVTEQYTTPMTPGGYVNNKIPENHKNKIANLYNKKLNQLNAITPQTEEVRHAFSKLAFERDFYISEIAKDSELHGKLSNLVKTVETLRATGQVGGHDERMQTELIDQRKLYSEQIQFLNTQGTPPSDQISKNRPLFERLQEIKKYPDLAEQYELILENRIEGISTELGKIPPKK